MRYRCEILTTEFMVMKFGYTGVTRGAPGLRQNRVQEPQYTDVKLLGSCYNINISTKDLYFGKHFETNYNQNAF